MRSLRIAALVLATVGVATASAAGVQMMKETCPGNSFCSDSAVLARQGGDDLKGKYPWWTGVELGNPNGKVKIEVFLSYTCPGCKGHWYDIVKPLMEKYGDRISLIHQPFALPYQPYSYDSTTAAFAAYRLTNNDVKTWVKFSESMFNNQMTFYKGYDKTQKQMWEETFVTYATQLGIDREKFVAAMNGTLTTAGYDAWYSARYARQRTLPGAPSFIVAGWIPWQMNVVEWTFADWSKWLDKNL